MSKDETKKDLLPDVSYRLLISLAALLAAIVAVVVADRFVDSFISATPWVCLLVGAIGGFIGLQRRLKTLPEKDLNLIASSWIYTLLAPFTGGILAVLLYILFISGLLGGDIFPEFIPDNEEKINHADGFEVLFAVHGANGAETYAKLVFWSFLAGFSEKFVIDILSQFESKSTPTV